MTLRRALWPWILLWTIVAGIGVWMFEGPVRNAGTVVPAGTLWLDHTASEGRLAYAMMPDGEWERFFADVSVWGLAALCVLWLARLFYWRAFFTWDAPPGVLRCVLLDLVRGILVAGAGFLAAACAFTMGENRALVAASVVLAFLMRSLLSWCADLWKASWGRANPGWFRPLGTAMSAVRGAPARWMRAWLGFTLLELTGLTVAAALAWIPWRVFSHVPAPVVLLASCALAGWPRIARAQFVLVHGAPTWVAPVEIHASHADQVVAPPAMPQFPEAPGHAGEG